MLLLVSSLLLCACANGLAVGENKAAPSPLVYETYADTGRYLFDPTPQNWTDASKICRLYNGHLAFPKTQDEADALWSIMTRYNVSQVHAGFHDQFVEGEYYTAKGRLITETTFNNWSSGAPIGGSSFNCGGLRGDGLVDVACKDIFPSICEENEPSGNNGFLDYDYIAPHGFYKLFLTNALWPNAMKSCYDQGAHLWVINSEGEKNDIFNHYNVTNTMLYIPVGAHHMFADRYFVTIFDDTLESTGYSTWEAGEPSGSNIEYPYLFVSNGGLSIRNIFTTYVCEYNPIQQTILIVS